MIALMVVIAYLIIGAVVTLKDVELIEEIVDNSKELNELPLLYRRISLTFSLTMIVILNPIKEIWFTTRSLWWRIDLIIFRIKLLRIRIKHKYFK